MTNNFEEILRLYQQTISQKEAEQEQNKQLYTELIHLVEANRQLTSAHSQDSQKHREWIHEMERIIISAERQKQKSQKTRDAIRKLVRETQNISEQIKRVEEENERLKHELAEKSKRASLAPIWQKMSAETQKQFEDANSLLNPDPSLQDAIMTGKKSFMNLTSILQEGDDIFIRDDEQ